MDPGGRSSPIFDLGKDEESQRTDTVENTQVTESVIPEEKTENVWENAKDSTNPESEELGKAKLLVGLYDALDTEEHPTFDDANEADAHQEQVLELSIGIDKDLGEDEERERRESVSANREMEEEEQKTGTNFDREEGELSPELVPENQQSKASEPKLDESLKLKSIKHYYERLGEIYAEAQRMTLQLRKGFSQLFEEGQLDELENQFKAKMPEQNENLPESKRDDQRSLKDKASALRRGRSAEKSRGSTRRDSERNRRGTRIASRYSSSPKSGIQRRKRRSRSPRRTNICDKSQDKQTKRSPSRSRRRSRSRSRGRHRSLSKTRRDFQGKFYCERSNDKRSPNRCRLVRSPRRESASRGSPKRKTPPSSSRANDRVRDLMLDRLKPRSIGNKREKQRVKTLVTRQMRMISQYIESEPKTTSSGPMHNTIDSRNNDRKQRHEKEKPSAADIETLEGLEMFLDELKRRNKGKIYSDEKTRERLAKLKSRERQFIKPLTEANSRVTTRAVTPEMTESILPKKKGLYFQSSNRAKRNYSSLNTPSTLADQGASLKGESKVRPPHQPNPESTESKSQKRPPVKFEFKSSRAKVQQMASIFSETAQDADKDKSDKDESVRDPKKKGEQHYPSCENNEAEDVRNNYNSSNHRKRGPALKCKEGDSEKGRAKNGKAKEKHRQRKYTESESESSKGSDENTDFMNTSKRRQSKHEREITSMLEPAEKLPPVTVTMKKTNQRDSSTKKIPLVAERKRKRIIILGDEKHLKRLQISPELRKLLISSKLKRGILLKVQKRKKQKMRNKQMIKNTATADPSFLEDQEQNHPKCTLQEMEAFIEELREKHKTHTTSLPELEMSVSDHVPREMRFLDRHRARRKAKLMACVVYSDRNTDREAKILESMKRADKDEDELEREQVLKKLKAEHEAIMLCPEKAESRIEKRRLAQYTIRNNANFKHGRSHQLPQASGEVKKSSAKIPKAFDVSFALKSGKSSGNEVDQNIDENVCNSAVISCKAQTLLNNLRAKKKMNKKSTETAA